MNVMDKNSGLKSTVSIEALLLQQHRLLLVKQIATQNVGRLLSFGVLIYAAISTGSSMGLSRITWLAIGCAATIVGFFWLYLTKVTQGQVERLEEVIVQGNDVERDSAKQPEHFVSSKQDKDSGEADRWIQIYIQWKHEGWKHSSSERLVRLEPLVWWGLITMFVLFKLIRP